MHCNLLVPVVAIQCAERKEEPRIGNGARIQNGGEERKSHAREYPFGEHDGMVCRNG